MSDHKESLNRLGARKWLTLRNATEIELKGEISSKDWATEMQEYQSSVSIEQDETFDKIPHAIPKFHTIKLTEYQRSTVQTMITLERKRWISLTTKKANVALYYSAARLSERIGSGKTIEVLALICLQPHPAIVPDIRGFDTITRPEKYVGRANLISVKYNPKNILKPTLICVGPSVITQWKDTIRTFTDLELLTVRTKLEFEELLDSMEDGSVNKYDIVLVKNGHVGSGFKWPDYINVMKKNEIKNPWTMNILSNYTKKPWARVVVDDADTIRMPYNITPIPCKFLWIVSSTNNVRQRAMGHNKQYHNVADLLSFQPYGYWRIQHNGTLMAILNVNSTNKYIMDYNGLSNPHYSVMRFENVHDKMIGLLGAIDDDTAREVREMLNNDAFKDAAEKIGIASRSIADIFQSLLGNKFLKFKEAEAVLAFISTIPDDPKSRKPFSKNPDQNDTYTKARILKKEMPKYNYPNLKHLIEETKATYEKIYEDCGKAVNRVKDNIKHGECPICREDLTPKNIEVFILKCCDAVYCASCAIEVLEFNKSSNKKLASTCRKCRQPISIKKMIYVGTNIDKFDIADPYALILSDLEKESEEKDDTDEQEEYNKASAIADFCCGKKTKSKLEKIKIRVPGIMGGFAKLPVAEHRKVLIYALKSSVCSEITKKLENRDVKYWKLRGTVKQLSTIARKFNKYDGDCALIIQSEKHYAGLNLQTATHAILYGVPHNESILSQFIGRGQRMGRTYQFNIIFMVYENEFKSLIENYTASLVDN